ncbi:MAG: GIY-YIG nuclease family protein [Brevinema sp.]
MILFTFIFLFIFPLHAQEEPPLNLTIDEGYIYVLSNKAMPRLIKIGFTQRQPAQIRVNEISRQTGVPVPFDIIYVARVTNVRFVEKKLHLFFAKKRNNKRKEFFRIDPEQAKQILQILQGPQIEQKTKAQS